MNKTLFDKHQTPIEFLGPNLEKGKLPAFFYFALSSSDSLTLHPYNQPALHMADEKIRVFSFMIPGHEPGLNKFHAMQYWADQMRGGFPLLGKFFEQTEAAIGWLIEQGLVDPEHMGAGGLSRGGFIATHIAARLPSLHTLLGFAPLTELAKLQEFSSDVALQRLAADLDLIHLAEHLTHVHHIRFYIGNLDTRVSTDACYQFIRKLAEVRHAKHARRQKVELMITQSIGHHGHGTDPQIFLEGALWAKQQLLKEAS